MKTIREILSDNKISGEFADRISSADNIFKEIYLACNSTFKPGDGSYLFLGGVYEYSHEMFLKQEMLYNLCKNINSVLEIGTYMGHSLLIMLLSNPFLKISCIDLNDQFTRPSIEVLRKHFPHAEISFYHGNSIDVMPILANSNIENKFDLFHIDGQHLESHIVEELNFCKKMTNYNIDNKKAIRVVFDDVHCCQELINSIVASNDVIKYTTPNCIWKNSYLEFFL